MKGSSGPLKAFFIIKGLLMGGFYGLGAAGAFMAGAQHDTGLGMFAALCCLLGVAYLVCGISLNSLLAAHSEKLVILIYSSIGISVLGYVYSLVVMHDPSGILGVAIGISFDLYILKCIRGLEGLPV